MSRLKNLAYMALAMNVTNSMGASGILENPFRAPKQVVLIGTMAEDTAKSYFFIDDACALASQTGQVSTADTEGVAFTTRGISIANIKSFLVTHALIVGGFNFNSSDPSQLTNNLETLWTNLDQSKKTDILFSSLEVSNMQYNPNLLNIVDQPFIWTNQTALKILAAAQPVDGGNTVYTFTMKIAAAVPYGQLDEFLESEKIPSRNKG